MSAFKFFMPTINHMGEGCLTEAINDIAGLGLGKALIVTDKVLNDIGLVASVVEPLGDKGITSVIYEGTKPNPTCENVRDGLALLKENDCDFIISLGGGSPHDCAKGIALVATNGGKIEDYAGIVDASDKPQLPLVAINTTAGTASEISRFSVITDVKHHTKMVIVDKNVTPVMSVNDPALMKGMPASLTAATGMDALTHAVEAYVSTLATPVTDCCALKAIRLIASCLRRVVDNGEDMEARDHMAYAQLLAGMAFNSASLGYVHAMAHQLGGFYDLPHGVCNAVLLPHVQQYNAQVCPGRLADVARAMGKDVEGTEAPRAAEKALEAIRELSASVDIPAGLRELDVKEDDLDMFARNALKDGCALTNPRQATHEEILAIYRNAM